MINGISLPNPAFNGAFNDLSDHAQQILESVLRIAPKNVKVTGKTKPSVSEVAKLPNIYSYGFLMIYNQLQKLLKPTSKEVNPLGGTIASGLGKFFNSLGIGIKTLGIGFSFLAAGFKVMANPTVAVGIGVASLAGAAMIGLIALLAKIDQMGFGPGAVLKELLSGLGDGVAHMLDALANVIDKHWPTVKGFLDEFQETLKIAMPAITQLISEFGNVIGKFVDQIDDIIRAIGDFADKVIHSLFDNVTTSIERLARVNGKNLLLVGAGLISVSTGLAAFAAGSTLAGIVDGISSIFNKLTGRKGVLEKLQEFSKAGPGLRDAGEGLNDLSNGLMSYSKLASHANFDKKLPVERVLETIQEFASPAFRKAMNSLYYGLEYFETFTTSLFNLSQGMETLGTMSDRTYNKSLKRLKEIGNVTRNSFGSLPGLTEHVEDMAGKLAGTADDAIFTLESTASEGTYFNTDQGIIKTNPRDRLTVVASPNMPEDTNNFNAVIVEKMDILLNKLDSYIEAIKEKEPDVNIIQSEIINRSPVDELLKVGV